MFRSRRMPRFAVSAALVAASLSLAACQSGTGVETEGRAPAVSPSASPDRAGSGGGGAHDERPARPVDHKPSDDRKGEDGPVTERCDASNTELTVKRVSRPINRLLLTATNTGDTVCNAYGHPYLRFDEAHAPVPALEDSRPQAVVSMAPGESVHAGIMTMAAVDTDVVGVTELGVLFSDRDGGSVGTRPVRLALPEDTVISSNAWVTYWQDDLDAALMW